jgi:SPP1 gp7 family putative phage head morphogenesis protein
MLLLHDAGKSADALLGEFLGLRLNKAVDLDDPGAFDRAVATLAAELRSKTNANDTAAVRSAIKILDVDWKNTTAQGRRDLISRAMDAAARATRNVPKQSSTTFGPAADEIVQATRDHSRRVQNLNIAADFNALDRRIVSHLKKTQAAFVRDEYGRRLDQFGEEARRIVAEGLEAGLGRDDIAGDLQRAANAALVKKSPFYWEVVAGAFVSNGRSFAQMSSYAEAGIERYIIEAVLDERTTEICRFLHGKTFSVKDALGRFERIEAMESPEDIKQVQPWVREALDPDTGRKALFVGSGDARIPITEVTRSAFGTRDDRGEFRGSLSEREMMDLGISFPPYHGLCRTTTVADVS